jgi:hypothetical protein
MQGCYVGEGRGGGGVLVKRWVTEQTNILEMVKWPAYAPTKMECFLFHWILSFFFFFFWGGVLIKTKNFLENKIGECPKPRSELPISIENILIKTKKKEADS